MCDHEIVSDGSFQSKDWTCSISHHPGPSKNWDLLILGCSPITLFRVLQSVCSSPARQSDASTITRGIKHLTATSTSNEALQQMLTPAQHALAATSPQLRVLGCDILSVWLRKQEPSVDVTQPVLLLIHMLEVWPNNVSLVSSAQSPVVPLTMFLLALESIRTVSRIQGSPIENEVTKVASHGSIVQYSSSALSHTKVVLEGCIQMQDGETDVAAAAASALECLAVSPERLKLVLEPAPKQGLLASALGHEDATVRSRALALTVNLAATSQEAADIVLASGEHSIYHTHN